MTINELNVLLNQGGATFKNGEVVTYESGYQVAILYNASEYDNTPEEYQALLEAINDGNLPDGGIWYNGKTNKIEVDLLTVNISNKQDAINLARHFNQKTIYDWKNLDIIYI